MLRHINDFLLLDFLALSFALTLVTGYVWPLTVFEIKSSTPAFQSWAIFLAEDGIGSKLNKILASA